jgi:hypothetical protein
LPDWSAAAVPVSIPGFSLEPDRKGDLSDPRRL